MVLEKFSCTWAKPLEMGGEKSKDASLVLTAEIIPSRSATTGTAVSTMENGDKVFIAFRDTTPIKDSKSEDSHGTWSYVGGTAKFRGLKGKGTYTTIFNADGSSTAEVEGDYDLPKAKKSATGK